MAAFPGGRLACATYFVGKLRRLCLDAAVGGCIAVPNARPVIARGIHARHALILPFHVTFFAFFAMLKLANGRKLFAAFLVVFRRQDLIAPEVNPFLPFLNSHLHLEAKEI